MIPSKLAWKIRKSLDDSREVPSEELRKSQEVSDRQKLLENIRKEEVARHVSEVMDWIYWFWKEGTIQDVFSKTSKIRIYSGIDSDKIDFGNIIDVQIERVKKGSGLEDSVGKLVILYSLDFENKETKTIKITNGIVCRSKLMKLSEALRESLYQHILSGKVWQTVENYLQKVKFFE